MLHANLLCKGKRRRDISDLEFTVVILTGFDGNQLAVQLIKQRQLKLDAVRQVHNTVRTRHQAKCRQRQNAEERHNLRRCVSNGKFSNDEQEERAYDECLDDHARKLTQKEIAAIGSAVLFIILLELPKKILLLPHDFCFFDCAQPLIHGADIPCGKGILYLTRLFHTAAEGAQEHIDHPAHNPRDDDRCEWIGGDQHQPDRQCRNDFGEKLKCGN